MANEALGLPSTGGGLMRFKEEYNSKFKFGPWIVIGMVVAVVLFVLGLKMFN
jgi:preprotein translocase subunit Sec61beta